jgi:hypothetical protein
MRAWARPVAVALLGVTVQAAEQPAVEGMETGRYLTPRIRTTSTSGIAGHTTFTVSVTLATRSPQQDSAISIYAIFGDSHNDAHLRLPPCYHVPAPFGVNIGGTNPAFWEVAPDAQYDSWLSVGETRGNVHNQISSIGIAWVVRIQTAPRYCLLPIHTVLVLTCALVFAELDRHEGARCRRRGCVLHGPHECTNVQRFG